jgi:hypothetical protein
MKGLSILTTIIFLCFGTGTSLADCGKAHEGGTYTPHKMGKISGTNFDDLDTDKSGGISFEEFKAAFPKTSQKGFNMLDKDGDGKLNAGEWQEFKDAHKGMGGYHKKPETT